MRTETKTVLSTWYIYIYFFFSTFRGVHTLIFTYVPYIVISLHGGPANFNWESEALFLWLAISLLSGGFISNLFGDYEKINMWKSDFASGIVAK